MIDFKKAAQKTLQGLELAAQGLDEDCGEPGCQECRTWRPLWALMEDVRFMADRDPVAWMTHENGLLLHTQTSANDIPLYR